jgi:capsular exopolysaccharide synthesis family protein
VGDIPPNPQELLASQKLQSLLKRLGEIYDRIIIDCPPVLPVSDSLILANSVDAAIYVVRSDKTPVAQIRRGLELLRRTRVEMLGIALNQTDISKSDSYGDYGAYLSDNYSAAGMS